MNLAPEAGVSQGMVDVDMKASLQPSCYAKDPSVVRALSLYA